MFVYALRRDIPISVARPTTRKVPRIPSSYEERLCAAQFDGWHCTLSAGHEGLHAAHTHFDDRPQAAWGVQED